MKRITSIILAVALCIGILSGCSGKQESTAENQPRTKMKEVVITIDEWIGYGEALIANGGLVTKPGSINDQLGIKVKYVIMNDRTESSNALIAGHVQGCGYTINSTAFLQNKFNEAGMEIVMPMITNYSNGADGILVKKGIKNVSELVGKKIAYPEFSESQTLVEWLLRHSQLSAEELAIIRNDMVPFKSPEDTFKALSAGEVDAAATWDPYITEAKSTLSEFDVLFDTSMATGLILSGFVFNKDFVEKNEDFIVKWMDGLFQAVPLYKTEELIPAMKEMPLCQSMSDTEIMGMSEGADLTTCLQNERLLTGQAIDLYREMAEIWKSLGEEAYPQMAEQIFTDKYVKELLPKYPEEGNGEKIFDKKVEDIESAESLIDYKAEIQFEINRAVIKSEDSFKILDEFIKNAKMLDGAYIRIEGNTALRTEKATEAQVKQLSLDRANAVKDYFVEKGIDPARIVTIGNGDTKLLDEKNPASPVNRRTEFYFITELGF